MCCSLRLELFSSINLVSIFDNQSKISDLFVLSINCMLISELLYLLYTHEPFFVTINLILEYLFNASKASNLVPIKIELIIVPNSKQKIF